MTAKITWTERTATLGDYRAVIGEQWPSGFGWSIDSATRRSDRAIALGSARTEATAKRQAAAALRKAERDRVAPVPRATGDEVRVRMDAKRAEMAARKEQS